MVDILEGEMAQAGVPCTYLVRMQGCRSQIPSGQSHHHIDNKIQTQDGAMEDRQKMDEGVRNFGSDLILLLLIFKSTLVSCNG